MVAKTEVVELEQVLIELRHQHDSDFAAEEWVSAVIEVELQYVAGELDIKISTFLFLQFFTVIVGNVHRDKRNARIVTKHFENLFVLLLKSREELW